MNTNTIINDNEAVFAQEYDLSFPEESEYAAWIASLEADMAKQGLVVTNKVRFFTDDDYSPFSTVNS